MNTTATIPVWALVPFLLMLGAIAVFPLSIPRFWDKNGNKLIVSLALGVPATIGLFSAGMPSVLYDSIVFDYVPFIILLGALFVITGGLFIEVNVGATPASNTGVLAAGTLLASVLGTTGASMLMIRPLLHTNRHRAFKTHTVLFFIATVSNSGGLLTPLGDPPLFMMYLRGVPFEWFLKLFPVWCAVNVMTILVYFAVDAFFWRRESDDARTRSGFRSFAVEIRGRLNFVWLLGVVLAVALINSHTIPALAINRYCPFVREAVILLMAYGSLAYTPHLTRVSNGFTWHPINEVAALFLGIFITMAPCLIWIESHAHGLGVESPVGFYYATGLLSSFLDNTPTAVTFHSLAQGLGAQGGAMVAGIPEALMRALCLGAVLFGAMTYIGNGPNFMVRTLAEHQGVPMPEFAGYVVKFSLPVLLPIYVLIQVLFV